MFKPVYEVSNRLLENIKHIAVLVADLNNKKFPKVVLAEMERSARELSSYSSTSIEGNPLPLTDVRRILKNAPKFIRDSEKEVLNYNKILLKLHEADEAKNFNLNLILEIQKHVTDGLLPKNRCGKLREEPVFVNNPKTRQTVYLPPDHKDVPDLMKDLLNFINQNKNKIDPLILAGIFHKEFVIIHPFIDGNGRTARLATKILLAAMGLDTFNLFSFENYYNKNVSRYFESVGVLGDYYELKDKINFTLWLEYFTDGIIDELLRVGKILQNKSVNPENELKPHHKKLINFIEQNGYINDPTYAKIVKRAKATRILDFKKLLELGLIERLGKGKNTYYKLKTK